MLISGGITNVVYIVIEHQTLSHKWILLKKDTTEQTHNYSLQLA